jgi:antitoxin component YwqK of YwqJK toxin-antitoxin module
MKISYLSFPLILFALLFAFISCSKTQGPEEITLKFSSGNKKETAIFKGKKPERIKIKSFEYYETGEKKKEYYRKDKYYFGAWTYWYREGSVLAMGVFDRETIDPALGSGRVIYYWPAGSKMIDMDVRFKKGERVSYVTYYDAQGTTYTEEEIPKDLKKRIQIMITKWDKGKI